MKWLAILVFLTGCVGTVSTFITPTKWGPVVEHPDSIGPCKDKYPWAMGCYAWITGHEVWYFGLRARQHEMAHVAGMRHGDWTFYRDWTCAEIVAGGDTAYRTGDRICLSSSGAEWIN